MDVAFINPEHLVHFLQLLAFDDESVVPGEFEQVRERLLSDDTPLHFVLTEVLPPEKAFRVDWKDFDGFMAGIEEMTNRLGLSEELLAELVFDDDYVEAAMPQVQSAFEAYGLTLWRMETSMDEYIVFLSQSADDAPLSGLLAELGLMASASETFF
ncbi:hypothetical protein AB8Q18_11590 [Neisseriaceae bacterium CLB008]|nr:hypothetical protein [Neisseriaceae bacterium]